MPEKAKNRKLTISLLACSPFFALLASCGQNNTISGIRLASQEVIQVPYGNFSYSGIKVIVDFARGDSTEIDLDESMISEVERLKFFKHGAQDVKVVFRERFETTMKINVVLNKFNDVYELVDQECVYDGLPHYLSLNRELPEGAVINYPFGNNFTNAGTYNIVGVISKYGYESKTLQATLAIKHKAHEQEISFADQSFVYTGEAKTIEATNVPEGVNVEYTLRDYVSNTRLNKAVNVGKYKVIARFTNTNNNYETIEDKTAILTIEKAKYDMSKIVFADDTKTYDGNEYVPSVSNVSSLPNGVKVNYRFEDENGKAVAHPINVGKYKMFASFEGGDIRNYEPIEPMEANLTINPRTEQISDIVSLMGQTLDYDGNAHSLQIELNKALPSNIEVSYEGNGKTYAGEHKVTAYFTSKDPNVVLDVTELSAFMVIRPITRSVLTKNDVTGEYDAPFGATNLYIENGKPNIRNVEPGVILDTVANEETGEEIPQIHFYSLDDGSEVPAADIDKDMEYSYEVAFRYEDEDLNRSVSFVNGIGRGFIEVK